MLQLLRRIVDNIPEHFAEKGLIVAKVFAQLVGMQKEFELPEELGVGLVGVLLGL